MRYSLSTAPVAVNNCYRLRNMAVPSLVLNQKILPKSHLVEQIVSASTMDFKLLFILFSAKV